MCGARQNLRNEIHLVQNGSVHSIIFRCCISNNALPHQLVTIRSIVLKI